ncbi:MAG: Abortive infection protein [Parcubacteria group bacterium GW2011_GWC2_39_14]|nr:MAG: Abortive infection protein [Parcubacteria group bacterium GW2011_GWC2_39_14]KKR54541.1 MAG: Abortive infection protein [Parcubacteria group bacterium GW2011_GWA2_40_23]
MIHSFSCKNFYSFCDLTTVNFRVNEKAPVNNGYFTAPSGNRLSKIETVIGPNASGKTNLLKIMPFLKWLIADSFVVTPAAPLPVKPFMFGEQKNKPTELSADFEIEGNVYTYSFSLDDTKILSEELKVKNKTNLKITRKKVFSRQWNEEIKKYELDDKSFNLPKDFENLLRTNASVVSTAVRFNHKESQVLLNFWQKVETNVTEAGWVGDHLLPNAGQQLFEALDFYSESKNETLKKEAEKLLSRFDLGLDSFDIKKEKKENSLSINVSVAHSFGDHTGHLPIQYESSGTKQLFVLLKTILLVLDKGGVAILDEFDVNLHPEMVLSLFSLFVQPETNPNNAQLLFSTHSHLVLSKLDKYQIILIEKNEKGASESWRLDEMAGVRADDNYYTKYIAGAYGAVPKL